MARLDAGETVRVVAAALSVAPSSVVKWSQRRRLVGSAAPGKIGGHVPRKIKGEHETWLRARMADAPFTPRGLMPWICCLSAGGRQWRPRTFRKRSSISAP